MQLSRELARRGHETLHLYSASFQTGKGRLTRDDGDPATFAVEPVDLGRTFDKYSALRRPVQELQYGRLAAARAERFAPDVVLSSNTPMLAQQVLLPRMKRRGARFVFWQQDIYSAGMTEAAKARIPVVGGHLGGAFRWLERRQLQASDAIVVISDDFRTVLRGWGIDDARVTVIENWAPLGEIEPLPRDNDWSRAHGLTGATTILYAGTLGLKHNPSLLLRLAERFRDRADVKVVVVSSGLGADWLAARAAALPNLVLLPFQPYEVLPQVLASGDVLAAILEPEAGIFSVPSKVLSYHCAGRPLLAAIPAENLAARLVRREDTGLVSEPGDPEAFAASAEKLLDAPELREAMGARAVAYATTAFDIHTIADRFEDVLGRVHAR